MKHSRRIVVTSAVPGIGTLVSTEEFESVDDLIADYRKQTFSFVGTPSEPDYEEDEFILRSGRCVAHNSSKFCGVGVTASWGIYHPTEESIRALKIAEHPTPEMEVVRGNHAGTGMLPRSNSERRDEDQEPFEQL